MLELELFGQLQLLADIAAEFEGAERERTEAEGMALLIALRELWRHLPELRHGEGLPDIIDRSAD